MNAVRRSAVAGSFYPDDPLELAQMIDGFLQAVPPSSEAAPPVALVVPHAGYVYSGPVAAAAYARLVPWRAWIRRVMVVGPAHRLPVRGLALSSASGFATPLGVVPVDTDAVAALLSRPSVYIDDLAHGPEHCIEVHLPFLQRALGSDWSLVPALAADIAAESLADVLSLVWGAPDTLVIVSTDLSHYHPIDVARTLDQRTAAAIVTRSWEEIGREHACGAVPLRAALELARRGRHHVEALDVRTSGDTAGTPDRVVGYGSFVVR